MKFMIRGISYKFKFLIKEKNLRIAFKLGLNYRIFFFALKKFIKLFATKWCDFYIFSPFRNWIGLLQKIIYRIKTVDPYKAKGIHYYKDPVLFKVGKIR